MQGKSAFWSVINPCEIVGGHSTTKNPYILGTSHPVSSLKSVVTGVGLAEGRECRTQLPARAIENIAGLVHVAAVQKQDGELHVAASLRQCRARLLAGAPGESMQNAFAATHQLLIDGLNIHHEAS